MTTILFNREVTDSIVMIARELKKMNELKEKELSLKYGSWAKGDD